MSLGAIDNGSDMLRVYGKYNVRQRVGSGEGKGSRKMKLGVHSKEITYCLLSMTKVC
jgi:hypothetical protein